MVFDDLGNRFMFFSKLNKETQLNDAFTKVTPLTGKLFHSPNNEKIL